MLSTDLATLKNCKCNIYIKFMIKNLQNNIEKPKDPSEEFTSVDQHVINMFLVSKPFQTSAFCSQCFSFFLRFKHT